MSRFPGSQYGKEAWLSYVKTVIRRYPNNIHAIENKAVEDAAQKVQPDVLPIIEAVYIKNEMSIRGAADESFLSYTQTVERAKSFYREVANNLGLPFDDKRINNRKYLEDWHPYILNILSRYPKNRHDAERAAIDAALVDSDKETREFITRAYIQRAEAAEEVAFSLNIHPATMDHRKAKFFRRIAEELHLPTG